MIVNRYEKSLKIKLICKVIPRSVIQRHSERRYMNLFEQRKQNNDLTLKLVEIETLNRCNGECSFCPVNRHIDNREFKKMPESLFYKIIDDLENMKYQGMVNLFSNNEPLLDKRIVNFSKYAKQHLPDAKICMYTNGTLINMDLCGKLVQHLDLLIIDNYNDKLELNDNIKEIVEYCKTNCQWDEVIQVHLRKQNEILTTRGGSLQTIKKGK